MPFTFNPLSGELDYFERSSGHDPTGSVSLSAVNGTAATFMRSDAAPALDQSIAPVWTGIHEHQNNVYITDFPLILKGSVGAPSPINFFNALNNKTLSLYGAPTGNRSIYVPDISGDLVVTGNGNDPPSAAQLLGRVNRTNQSANIASVNLTNAAPSGSYLVTGSVACTTAEAGAGAVTMTLAWTGDSGARTTIFVRDMTLATSTTVFQSLYLASGQISWSISGYTDPAGGVVPKFNVRLRCTYVGL